MKKNSIYSLTVILSGALWGMMGFFRRRMDTMGFTTTDIILVRCGVGALLFAVAILVSDPSALKLKLKDLWCFVGSGIFSLLFFTLCYFQAMTMMSLSVAAILLYTAPCFVMLMSALIFKEKITPRKVLAMVLAFGGCALVSGLAQGGGISLVGLLYGLGAGIGYALYSIFGKLAMERGYKSLTVNFYSCLFAAAGAAFIGGVSRPVGMMFSSGGSFMFCLCVAAVTCFFPYLLYTAGLAHIEAGKASILASVEPVIATLVGAVAFGESLTLPGVLGICLVLAAIALLELKPAGAEKRDNI